MAETIKSVLFVDYDSIHRRLAGDDESGAAERLAARVGAWVNGIETGRLFEAKPRDATRRRLLMRRCYADPALLGDQRATFMANGFQMVDCPTAEGRERNAAAVHMVLDTIDALEHPANYEEFILLSADTDLSPVLIRLRAHNRTTAIYVDPDTAETYKAIADAMIDESRLVSVLLSDEEPALEEEAEAPQAERSEVEALARRISAATNVPLFAPRTFAELFRHLVEELAENGYHFQTTAENVANRMAASGRNVTRRQVVFVVKGLALKGHVFSTSDTPDRLAEVFREQVLYLCDSAGVELDARAREVLLSWIVGHVSPASPGGSQDTEIKPAAPVSEAADDDARSAAKPGGGQTSRSSRKKQARQQAIAAKPAAPEPPPKREPEPPKPVAESAKPPGESKPPLARPAADAKPTPAATKPATPLRPVLKPAGGGSTPPRSGSASAGSAAARTALGAAAHTSPPPKKEPREVSEADKEAVESSILAAIAEAVDVLVEDSGSKAKPSPAPTSAGNADTAPPERRPPEPVPDENPESDDIGDEIQRIIASYNRNRNRDERR